MGNGAIKHRINALHVYCRIEDILDFLGKYESFFQDKNRNIRIGRSIGRWIERNLYNGNGGARISKVIKFPKDLCSKVLSRN